MTHGEISSYLMERGFTRTHLGDWQRYLENYATTQTLLEASSGTWYAKKGWQYVCRGKDPIVVYIQAELQDWAVLPGYGSEFSDCFWVGGTS